MRPLPVLLLALLFVAVTTSQIPYEERVFAGYDLHFYRQVAEAWPGIGHGISAPFAYRIAGPWLAAALPFPLDVSFYVLTLALTATATVLFYLLLRQYVSSATAIIIAGVGFVLSKYLVVFTVFDYFQVKDMAGLCGAILMLLLIKRRQPAWAGLTMVATVPFSEGILALAPALLWASRDRRTVLTVFAAVGVFAVIRLTVDASGATLVDQWEQFGFNKLLRPYALTRTLVTPFLPLLIVPVIYWRSTLNLARNEPHLALAVAGVFGGAMFGGNAERLMLLAAPVVFLAVGYALDRNNVRGLVPVAGLLFAVVIASQHHQYTALPFPVDRMQTAGIMAVSTGIAGLSVLYRQLGSVARALRVRHATPTDAR